LARDRAVDLDRSPIDTVSIRIERQSANVSESRRHWFCIEESVGAHMELIDVFPETSWRKDNAMIATGTGGGAEWFLARLRPSEDTSCDFLVALRYEGDISQPRVRWHVMTASRSADLTHLWLNHPVLQQLRFDLTEFEKIGKTTAKNGSVELSIALVEEQIANEPMFILRLEATTTPKDVVENYSRELQEEFMSIL